MKMATRTGFAVIALLGALGLGLLRTFHAFVMDLRLMEPAPVGLREKLLALPRVVASAEQIAVLRRDGAVKIPNVINDRQLLSELKPLLVKHKIHGTNLPSVWHMNGAIRVLLSDSPLAGLASSVFNSEPVWTTDSQVWVKAPGLFGSGKKNKTGDVHCDEWWIKPPDHSDVISMWLAITDAPMSMGFYNGSHRHGPEIQRSCNRAEEKGPRYEYELNRSCLDALESDSAYALGSPLYFNLSAQSGDVILFNGSTFHAGITQGSERVAYSVRVRGNGNAVPPAQPCNSREVVHRDSWTGRPQEFSPTYPLPLHPPESLKTHFDCLPWAIAPELGRASPFAPPATEGRMDAMSYAKLLWPYLAGRRKLGLFESVFD
mmetsp:Transcript_40777/g.110296  ORF Transcript_40777/g.110296 Transcript_40777/m.110296 type:complete len:375 (-) Transcript_40777:91-1215(-)